MSHVLHCQLAECGRAAEEKDAHALAKKVSLSRPGRFVAIKGDRDWGRGVVLAVYKDGEVTGHKHYPVWPFAVDCRKVQSGHAETLDDARGMAGAWSDENPDTLTAITDPAGNVVDIYLNNKALGVKEYPAGWHGVPARSGVKKRTAVPPVTPSDDEPPTNEPGTGGDPSSD